MTGREYVGMYVTVLKGLGVGLVILIGMLALWGLQVHLIEVLAAALGATAIEAREWGGLGGVPTVLELLGVLFGVGWLEDNGGVGGIVGQVSGFVHERTCRDARCFLCSEWQRT